jgi:hypothetical protein
MAYLLAIMILMGLALTAHAAEWSPPAIQLPKGLKHPYVACTPEELDRVKAAYQRSGAEQKVVAALVAKAKEAIAAPVEYPPRGGQHNQWYQCDACQIALKTIDDTHHQCPRCQKIYTGAPYDDVIFAKTHSANLTAARDAAWAFAVTGEKPYADFAAGVLKGYAKRYRDYPYHDNSALGTKPGKSGGHLAEQTLNESMMVTWQIAPAYDLIYDTMSADDRRDVEDNLIRPMLENIGKHRAGKNNWQTWHNAAFITGGAVMGDIAWVKRAIDDKDNGFLDQMRVSVSQDGMWYENSWGYHFYTLQALAAITEQARRLNLDLWHHPAIKPMFTLPVRYTMPDGSLPRYGDDVSTSALKQQPLLAQAANAFRDRSMTQLVSLTTFESILLGVKPEPNTKPVIEGSEVFTSAGHAILRTQGDAGLAAAITFGPFGGFHGHFDKLSFVFYGYGKELGVDPGRAASQAYRLPIHNNWYRATLSHNAVVVDGKSQEGASGLLLNFNNGPNLATTIVSCGDAYKGVAQTRAMILTPGYLLVIDHLTADSERRFDWVYHHRGTGVSSTVATGLGSIPEPYTGNEFLQNLKAGVTDQPAVVDFTGDVGLRLTFDASPGSELLIGDGPFKSVDDRVPMAMLTRRGKDIRFVAVLEPTANGQPPKVTAVTSRPENNGAAISITREGKTDRVFIARESLDITLEGMTSLKTTFKPRH